MDLKTICNQTVELVQPVAQYILESFGDIRIENAKEKSKNSLVSHIDINAEKQLVKGLTQIIPEAGFVTEEDTVARGSKSLYWVIDPLDGTTNFLFGIPAVSISIALKKEGKTVMGVIHHVNSGDTYHCILGGGAWKNEKRIAVSQRKTIEESLVATGFPYESGDFLPVQMKLIEYFIKQSRGVRRLGSAAIDLAYVAEGIFDIYFESGLNEWDTSAGILLVREAGGHSGDLEGNLEYEAGEHILATNSYLYHPALQVIQKTRSGLLD